MTKCSHGLTSAECYVCVSPKYGAPAAVAVTDAMVEAAMRQWMAATSDIDAGDPAREVMRAAIEAALAAKGE